MSMQLFSGASFVAKNVFVYVLQYQVLFFTGSSWLGLALQYFQASMVKSSDCSLLIYIENACYLLLSFFFYLPRRTFYCCHSVFVSYLEGRSLTMYVDQARWVGSIGKVNDMERSLMTSLVLWPFLTYLPTLSYSVTSLFWSYLGPPYLP